MAYKWGMEAFRIAHDRVVEGRKDLLIVILKEKINVEKLPPDLRPYIRRFITACKRSLGQGNVLHLSVILSAGRRGICLWRRASAFRGRRGLHPEGPTQRALPRGGVHEGWGIFPGVCLKGHLSREVYIQEGSARGV